MNYSNIVKYIDSIVDDYKSFDDLPDSEKLHLCSLYWDFEDRDTYVISENEKVSSCIINYLQNQCSDSKFDLTESINESMLKTYGSRLDELFRERKSYSFQYTQQEHGLYPYVDMETGETLWRHV